MIKKLLPFLGLLFVTGVFFWQFLFKGLLPIPADTIVGLYHPYRDLYSKEYPNGIPFKNFLITDPVRQIYPWKELAIDQLSQFEFPTWNPYEMAGKPLLGNFQSSPFYPFNFLFLLMPFELSWSFLILLQPFLASIFMFMYLRSLKLDEYSSFFGGVIFAFSGFFVTWLEWGTILHSALWLPLILLSIDKISLSIKDNKRLLMWSIILVFATISSIFAGHLQTFFYLSLLSSIYILIRLWQKKNAKLCLIFLGTWLITVLITSVQLIPTLNFIFQSARDVDQLFWQKEGWFIPWQHLVQFIAPDFFGNPTTLNYWGVWNWAELTGYAGILPLIMAIYALFFRKDKKTLFFGSIFFISLIFSLPTPLSKLPFILDLPFISTAQPTRLLFLTNFSLAIVSSLGLNFLIKTKSLKEVLLVVGVIGILLVGLFAFLKTGSTFGIDTQNLAVAKRNMILPFGLFVLSALLITVFLKVNKKYKKYLLALFILLVIFDLFRFSWKFNTFSKKEYLFPNTKIVEFIKKDKDIFRVASTDSRIFPPNFLTYHRIASIEGYDPLYLLSYAELLAASERGEPNINPPFGFNRIITPHKLDSQIIDLLNVKYAFSLTDIDDKQFEKVFEEGQTKVYENREVLPRAFFVEEVKFAKDKQDAINMMFGKDFDPKKTAIIEEKLSGEEFGLGSVKIIRYSENEIIIESSNSKEGFLVLTDSFYPTWHAKINDREIKIYRTDFNFRGIYVKPGRNTIVFQNSLF